MVIKRMLKARSKCCNAQVYARKPEDYPRRSTNEMNGKSVNYTCGRCHRDCDVHVKKEKK